MRKLVAGFILIMLLPMIGKAQAPNDDQRPEIVPGPSPEALSPPSNLREISPWKSADSADTQSDAFNICVRATQRFEQQERAKGKTAEAPLSASCKTELKPGHRIGFAWTKKPLRKWILIPPIGVVRNKPSY